MPRKLTFASLLKQIEKVEDRLQDLSEPSKKITEKQKATSISKSLALITKIKKEIQIFENKKDMKKPKKKLNNYILFSNDYRQFAKDEYNKSAKTSIKNPPVTEISSILSKLWKGNEGDEWRSKHNVAATK